MLKEAINEDKDEYLKIKKINNHIIIKINPNIMLMQNKIPTYVATPFPP